MSTVYSLLPWAGMALGLLTAMHLAATQSPGRYHWMATVAAGAAVLGFAYQLGGA